MLLGGAGTQQTTYHHTVTEQVLRKVLRDLAAESLGGRPVPWGERVAAFRRLAESGRLRTMVPLLPLLLNLRGRPYTLTEHAPFEPVFNCRLPRELIVMSGRQVAKSTSSAARGVVLSNAIPFFSTLFITPLYEQVRRFSTQYVRPFIDQSPVKALWTGTTTENSVLQRSFKNLSKMFFSFALTDADRMRGIAADLICFDEVQDMLADLIPVVEEVLSHSKWRLKLFTGTPKTLDNTIEGLWQDSSQAEWCVPCGACGKLNVPAKSHDLDRMIGPMSWDIGPGRPGTVCARPQCGKPIFPAKGRWVHRFEDRRWDFPGYHVPQLIMPIHYADPERWQELLGKREGRNNTSPATFDNEVLGVSCDQGVKLVTESDLKKAAVLPWRNDLLGREPPVEPMARLNDYMARVLGADWGGGGDSKKKEGRSQIVSYTKYCVAGMKGDGKIDIIYGRKLLNPALQLEEATEVLKCYTTFRCDNLAHDYNGAGSGREALIVHAGLPMEAVVPMVYMATATQNIMHFHRSEQKHSRDFWMLDKARALVLVCQMIKFGQVRFFAYDYDNKDNPGLLRDFLALTENKIEMARSRDVYTIQRAIGQEDDFAHAVTFACCALWHRFGWPDTAALANLKVSEQQLQQIAPSNPWEEADAMGGYFGMP
jgi:hypothetical protein